MLTVCLKLVLSFFISENQSAFVQRRAISYNVIITHEILQYLKTSQAQKNCSMAVKTNKSKAYDMYELDFKSKVLQKIGFHTTWKRWIMQCITTVYYSYLVNDVVFVQIKPNRDIRLGDPLSLYANKQKY